MPAAGNAISTGVGGGAMGSKRAALAGAALLSIAQYAHAQNFNQMIAFGDSTTDTGWFARAPTGSGFAAAIFNGFIKNSLAVGGNAHFTGPGAGNAQILGSFFGLPAIPANAGGTNYAIGGAFDGATLGPGFQTCSRRLTASPIRISLVQRRR